MGVVQVRGRSSLDRRELAKKLASLLRKEDVGEGEVEELLEAARECNPFLADFMSPLQHIGALLGQPAAYILAFKLAGGGSSRWLREVRRMLALTSELLSSMKPGYWPFRDLGELHAALTRILLRRGSGYRYLAYVLTYPYHVRLALMDAEAVDLEKLFREVALALGNECVRNATVMGALELLERTVATEEELSRVLDVLDGVAENARLKCYNGLVTLAVAASIRAEDLGARPYCKGPFSCLVSLARAVLAWNGEAFSSLSRGEEHLRKAGRMLVSAMSLGLPERELFDRVLGALIYWSLSKKVGAERAPANVITGSLAPPADWLKFWLWNVLLLSPEERRTRFGLSVPGELASRLWHDSDLTEVRAGTLIAAAVDESLAGRVRNMDAPSLMREPVLLVLRLVRDAIDALRERLRRGEPLWFSVGFGFESVLEDVINLLKGVLGSPRKIPKYLLAFYAAGVASVTGDEELLAGLREYIQRYGTSRNFARLLARLVFGKESPARTASRVVRVPRPRRISDSAIATNALVAILEEALREALENPRALGTLPRLVSSVLAWLGEDGRHLMEFRETPTAWLVELLIEMGRASDAILMAEHLGPQERADVLARIVLKKGGAGSAERALTSYYFKSRELVWRPRSVPEMRAYLRFLARMRAGISSIPFKRPRNPLVLLQEDYYSIWFVRAVREVVEGGNDAELVAGAAKILVSLLRSEMLRILDGGVFEVKPKSYLGLEAIKHQLEDVLAVSLGVARRVFSPEVGKLESWRIFSNYYRRGLAEIVEGATTNLLAFLPTSRIPDAAVEAFRETCRRSLERLSTMESREVRVLALPSVLKQVIMELALLKGRMRPTARKSLLEPKSEREEQVSRFLLAVADDDTLWALFRYLGGSL